jgi:hypothetical protein
MHFGGSRNGDSVYTETDLNTNLEIPAHRARTGMGDSRMIP